MSIAITELVSPTIVDRRVYTDEDVYQQELDRLFHNSWVFVGLAAEIPEPGDFRTSWAGEIPLIVCRDKNGEIHVLENSCTHRGSMVAREPRGSCSTFTCLYHQWKYGQDGRLLGVPMQKEYGEALDKSNLGLRRARVEQRGGMVWASFDFDVEPLDEFLADAGEHVDGILRDGQVQVIGYHRFQIPGNWKLFFENSSDAYHVMLLHKFTAALGVFQDGENLVLGNGHGVVSTPNFSPPEEFVKEFLSQAEFKLQDLSMMFGERADGTNRVLGLFPNTIVLEQWDMINVRQIIPRGPNRTEVIGMALGEVGDSPEKLEARARSYANFHGPAGFVGRDDIEACNAIQDARYSNEASESIIKLGGVTVESGDLNGEFSVRGFYDGYLQRMARGTTNGGASK
ncbi:MAG: aromatic ring-hydroxylating dioxygenase subunit alpha [bacterium]|nr:aromatic ring-hydroxylating dioxygenase subunit alpha [bacterium]